jgi:hypothetical protein
MRDMEGALRGAMADEVADVSLPAGFAGQVRARYRRHRRIRVSATLASVVALVVAVPLATTAVLRDTAAPPPADAPAVDEVDGVELTYLPDGLVRDPVDGFDHGGSGDGWTALTGRWRPQGAGPGEGYDSGVRLTVFRGERPDLLPVLARTSGVLDEDERLPDEQDGRVVLHTPIDTGDGDGQWVDVFWHATDEVTLRVRVSDDLAAEVERIIDGVRVVGDGGPVPFGADRDAPPPEVGLCAPETNREIQYEFGEHDWLGYGGITVGHVPAQLAGGSFTWSTAARGLVDTAESGRWSYRFDWRFPADDSWPFTVRVTCGDQVPQDADELERFVADSGVQPLAPQPYQMPDGQPAFTVPDHFDTPDHGQRVAWLERPGAVIEVSMAPGVEDMIDEVVASVTVEPPGEFGSGDTCPLPEMRPGMLPWLAEGEPAPQPFPMKMGTGDEPGAGLLWSADPGVEWYTVPYVSVKRLHEPEVEPGDRGFEMTEVRGLPAELFWVGDPGVGQVRLDWREEPGECGVYSLALGTVDAWWLDTPVVDGQPCEEYSEECAAEFQRLLEVAIIEVADALE